MTNDLVNEPQKVQIDGNEYSFEYNYAALAALGNETEKGAYEIHDQMLSANGIKISDSLAIVCCGLMKHHSKKEVDELREKIKASPWLLLKVVKAANAAFLMPLLPPEIVQNHKSKSVKKK